jgi:Mg2+-importing ATPase
MLATGTELDRPERARLEQHFTDWTSRGIRVVAVATRPLAGRASYGRSAEQGLVFNGFLTFLDQPKEGAAQALAALARLGVAVKLITGDTRLVAQHVARLVGMRHERVLTGAELDEQLQVATCWPQRRPSIGSIVREAAPHDLRQLASLTGLARGTHTHIYM